MMSKKINLKPLDDRIVVQPLEAEEKTAGGLYLPDTAKEKPQRGTVVALGPGKLLDCGKRGEMSVAVGDESSTENTPAATSKPMDRNTRFCARPMCWRRL